MKKMFSLLGVLALSVCCIFPAAVYADEQSTVEFYGKPTVVLMADSAQALESLGEGELPASVWMEVNASMEVVAADNTSLGNFADVWTEQVSGKALPVVYPQNSAAYEAVAAYADANGVKDLAIASGDLSMLGSAAEDSFRPVYMAGVITTEAQIFNEISKANSVGAQTMVFDPADADAATVREVQARFKAVWLLTDGSAEQAADALGRGAYGIITPDPAAVYDLFDRMVSASGEHPAILGRAPYIAAHRGDWGLIYTENTLGAIESASQNGATHAEIDIQLTKDKQIVLYHNGSYPYHGTLTPIRQLTLAQMQEETLGDNISKVPTIDELFTAMQNGDTGDMILIIEFKAQESELITLFNQKVQQYGVAENVVVISFYAEVVTQINQMMPAVSTSLLLNTTDAESALSQAMEAKSGIDMSRDSIRSYYGEGNLVTAYADLYKTFTDRGYAIWMWTYETATMPEALRYGVTGITTNDCWYTMDHIKELTVSEVTEVDKFPAEGGLMDIPARTYMNEDVTVPARVLYLEKGEKEAKVLLIAEPEEGEGIVSETVTLKIAEDAPKGGCGSLAAASVGGAAVIVLGAAAALIVKKHA